jgi:hypothetical protein
MKDKIKDSILSVTEKVKSKLSWVYKVLLLVPWTFVLNFLIVNGIPAKIWAAVLAFLAKRKK